MVLQDDRRGQDHVGAAFAARQHRPGVPVVARGDGVPGPLRRVGHRQEGARVQPHQEVGGDERTRQGRLAGGPVPVGWGPGAGVLHDRRELQHPVGAVEFGRRDPYPALGLLGAQQQAADGPPRAVQHRFALLAGRPGEGEHHPLTGQRGHGDGQFDPFLGALVPGDQDPVGQVQFADVGVPAVLVEPLDGAAPAVQEAQLQVERRLAAGLHQDLGPLVGVLAVLGGPGGRHQDPELPAQPVLGRRGPVRVEHVALEEDGVRHVPGGVEAGVPLGGGGHGAVLSVTRGSTAPSRSGGGGAAAGTAPAAESSSARTVASQEASACRER